MQHQDGDVGMPYRAQKWIFAKKRCLTTRPAETLHAMRPRSQQQQARRVGFPQERQVDRQVFALDAMQGGMHVAEQVRTASAGRSYELVARLRIALGKVTVDVHCFSGKAASASAAR